MTTPENTLPNIKSDLTGILRRECRDVIIGHNTCHEYKETEDDSVCDYCIGVDAVVDEVLGAIHKNCMELIGYWVQLGREALEARGNKQ